MTAPTWHIKADAAPCAHNGDIGIVNHGGTLVAVAMARLHPALTLHHADMLAAAPDLIAGVIHEASLRAIDAGKPVKDWRSFVGPVLGPVMDRAMAHGWVTGARPEAST